MKSVQPLDGGMFAIDEPVLLMQWNILGVCPVLMRIYAACITAILHRAPTAFSALQVAADDDLWFHVRGMPGSHTLLRLPQRLAQPSDDDLQFAANLAAFFSRARDSLKVDVIVSKGAWVRKPRGAKPGAVMVTKELRNVVGRPGDCAPAMSG